MQCVQKRKPILVKKLVQPPEKTGAEGKLCSLSGDTRMLTVSLLYREKKPLNLSIKYWTVFVRAKSLQSCPTLCDPVDHSPPGYSVNEILQARFLEWVVMPSSRGSSWPRDRTHISCISCIGKQVLYHCTTWEAPNCHYNHHFEPLYLWSQGIFHVFHFLHMILATFP